MTANTQRGHQWNPQQGTKMTGGANYQMQGVASSTFPTNMSMGMHSSGVMMQQSAMGGNPMMSQPYQMQSNQMPMQMQPQFGGMQPQFGGMQQQVNTYDFTA